MKSKVDTYGNAGEEARAAANASGADAPAQSNGVTNGEPQLFYAPGFAESDLKKVSMNDQNIPTITVTVPASAATPASDGRALAEAQAINSLQTADREGKLGTSNVAIIESAGNGKKTKTKYYKNKKGEWIMERKSDGDLQMVTMAVVCVLVTAAVLTSIVLVFIILNDDEGEPDSTSTATTTGAPSSLRMLL